MPDHGVRLPPKFDASMGILGAAPYGWEGTPAYNTALLPTNDYFAPDSFAYERIDWDRFKQTVESIGKKPENLSNPPFLGSGQVISGDIPSWMRNKDGSVARILRGYMRRRKVDPAKPGSFTRLFFMFNPAQILRSYVSTADNPALDATGNLHIEGDNQPYAAPQMVQVNFELFFDRQVECSTIPDHPGVLWDLQAFDALAGGASVGTRTAVSGGLDSLTKAAKGSLDPAVPDVANVNKTTDDTVDWAAAQNILIDGTLLIDVVFSPYLAFEGVIQGAEAMFEKFTSRMTPTRMTLSVSMKLYRIGVDANQTQETPFTDSGSIFNPAAFDPNKIYPTQAAADEANRAGRANMANWAMQWAGKSQYDNGSKRAQGAPCHPSDTSFFDCSSLVDRAFRAIGWDEVLGLTGVCSTGGPGTTSLVSIGDSRSDVWQTTNIGHQNPQNLGPIFQQLEVGDIILHGGSPGHVVIFMGFKEFGSGGGPPDPTTVLNKKCMSIVQAAYPDAGGPGIGVIQSDKSGMNFYNDGHTRIMRAIPIKASPAVSNTSTPGLLTHGRPQ